MAYIEGCLPGIEAGFIRVEMERDDLGRYVVRVWVAQDARYLSAADRDTYGPLSRSEAFDVLVAVVDAHGVY